MAKTKGSGTSKRIRPALTPEARENQMIALAMDAAERQLQDGTASSQVITHFLKLATAKANLEKEKLELENELIKAKTESLQSAKKIEDLYENAILAMRHYSGQGPMEEDDNDDY